MNEAQPQYDSILIYKPEKYSLKTPPQAGDLAYNTEKPLSESRVSFLMFVRELKTYFKDVYLKAYTEREDKIPRTTEARKNHFEHIHTFLPDQNNFGYVPQGEQIEMQIVFDRSTGFRISERADLIVNEKGLKELAGDKWRTYELLKTFSPDTHLIGAHSNLWTYADAHGLSQNRLKKYVWKPRDGFGGRGVIIGTIDHISQSVEQKVQAGKIESDQEFILQEFRNTSNGIENIFEGTHDIRVFIADANVILCYVRLPKDKEVADESSGDEFVYIDFADLPESAKKKVQIIAEMVNGQFPLSYFSIDFGIDNDGNFFVYELNSAMIAPGPHPDRGEWAKKLAMLFDSKMKSSY